MFSVTNNVVLLENIVANFLSYLNFTESWSVRRVCKAWRTAADYPNCWEVLDLRWFDKPIHNLFYVNGTLNDKASWVSCFQTIIIEDNLKDCIRQLFEGGMRNLKKFEVYWKFKNQYIMLGIPAEVHSLLRKLKVENDFVTRISNGVNRWDKYITERFSSVSQNERFWFLRRIVLDCPVDMPCLRQLIGMTPHIQDVVLSRMIAHHDCIACCLLTVTEFVSALPENQLRVLQIGFIIDMKKAIVDDVSQKCAASRNMPLDEEEGDELVKLLITRQKENLICFWAPELCLSLEVYRRLKEECKKIGNLQVAWMANA